MEIYRRGQTSLHNQRQGYAATLLAQASLLVRVGHLDFVNPSTSGTLVYRWGGGCPLNGAHIAIYEICQVPYKVHLALRYGRYRTGFLSADSFQCQSRRSCTTNCSLLSPNVIHAKVDRVANTNVASALIALCREPGVNHH